MAVVIPSNFAVYSTTQIDLTTSATQQKPYLGGPTQRIARMGDRWTYKVDCHPMRSRQAGPFLTALLQGLTEKVLIEIKQDGVDTSAYSNGAVVGSATGRTLNHSGGGPAKFVGQFFSVIKNGVRYLHQISAVSSGTLTFHPMLKVPLVAGDILEFGAPKLEGFLEGNSQGWSVGRVSNLGLSFAVVEAQ